MSQYKTFICPVCLDKGMVIFEKLKNGIKYDTAAKCICPSGNKFSMCNVIEIGLSAEEIAKSNIEKHQLDYINGVYKTNAKVEFDVNQAKKMCKELQIYTPEEFLF